MKDLLWHSGKPGNMYFLIYFVLNLGTFASSLRVFEHSTQLLPTLSRLRPLFAALLSCDQFLGKIPR